MHRCQVASWQLAKRQSCPSDGDAKLRSWRAGPGGLSLESPGGEEMGVIGGEELSETVRLRERAAWAQTLYNTTMHTGHCTRD